MNNGKCVALKSYILFNELKFTLKNYLVRLDDVETNQPTHFFNSARIKPLRTRSTHFLDYLTIEVVTFVGFMFFGETNQVTNAMAKCDFSLDFFFFIFFYARFYHYT